MTKEITKTILLQEMQDRLGLREFAPANFLFEETVVPVYEVRPHLEKPFTHIVNPTVTETGGILCQAVPDDEIWKLLMYQVTFVTGTFTLAGIYVDRVSKESEHATCHLDLTAAQNTSYINILSYPLALYPGDKIMANVDGYTSTGVFWLIFDIIRETIR